MSDSEGTKELSGIARSIDALFSQPAADVVDDAGPESPPTTSDIRGDSLTGAPAVPDVPEPREESLLDSGEAEPPPIPDANAEPAVELSPPPLPDAVAGEEPARPPLPDMEPPDMEPPPSPPGSTGGEGATPGADDEVRTRFDEEARTPLDEAVDAYLAGDRERAAEIESTANEMLERRELDPVARSVGRLAAAAGDPPDESILEVARAIASPVVYGRLARHVGAERDEDRRQQYFLACRNLGEPMGAAIRDDLAESTDRLARRVYCEALVEMGSAGREIIEAMAVGENRFLVRNAVAILGETGGERAVELVTSALANPDARVRKEALRSLAKLGDEESGELVLGLLDDSDREVRMAAAVAAGELHVERALRHLVRMLDETNDPGEVVPLMRALGHLGDPGAVASIEQHIVPKLFSRPPSDLRIVGYRALHQIGTPHARRLLNQALDDKDPEVKAAVKEILGMR